MLIADGMSTWLYTYALLNNVSGTKVSYLSIFGAWFLGSTISASSKGTFKLWQRNKNSLILRVVLISIAHDTHFAKIISREFLRP